jgi:hypothetical protein
MESEGNLGENITAKLLTTIIAFEIEHHNQPQVLKVVNNYTVLE